MTTETVPKLVPPNVLDVEGAPRMERMLLEAAEAVKDKEEPEFHLDMTSVELLDSSGFQALQRVIIKHLERGQVPTVTLHGLSGHLRRVARIYLDRLRSTHICLA